MKVTIHEDEMKEAIVQYLNDRMKGNLTPKDITIKVRRKSNKNELVGSIVVEFEQ